MLSIFYNSNQAFYIVLQNYDVCTEWWVSGLATWAIWATWATQVTWTTWATGATWSIEATWAIQATWATWATWD